jgi:hypothetical protein
MKNNITPLFLDLTIYRNKTKLEFAIYRKHTQTDITIPNDSCHAYEHKRSGIDNLANNLQTYPITKEAKKMESNIIKNTLHNNKYNINLDMKHPDQQEQNINTDPQHQKTNWATFTYRGKETRKITKFFKKTQIKVAFRTQNTIQNIVKLHSQIDKYEKSGIYQIKCMDCPLQYVRQTGRTFCTRNKEHIQEIRNNNSKFRVFQSHTECRTHIWAYNPYTAHHKNREKRKILKHIRKIPYIKSIKTNYT